MKKLLFLMLAMSISLTAFSQRSIDKRKRANASLSPHEIVVTTDFFIPKIRYNYYFNDKMIYHLDRVKTGLLQGDEKQIGTSQWLEFRRGNKWFVGHGPTVGLYAERTAAEVVDDPYQWNPYVTAGYSVGVGRKIGKHITIGTRINPYVELTEGDFTVRRTNPLQVFSNIYGAYRF